MSPLGTGDGMAEDTYRANGGEDSIPLPKGLGVSSEMHFTLYVNGCCWIPKQHYRVNRSRHVIEFISPPYVHLQNGDEVYYRYKVTEQDWETYQAEMELVNNVTGLSET